jgi:hypothetical protein
MYPTPEARATWAISVQSNLKFPALMLEYMVIATAADTAYIKPFRASYQLTDPKDD